MISFYQKQTTQSEHEISSNYSSETEGYDQLEDTDGLAIVEQDNALMENVSIGDVVNKVRRVVKLFKRSPLKKKRKGFSHHVHIFATNLEVHSVTRV